MTIELKEYVERIIDEHDRHNLTRIKTLENQVAALEALVNAKQDALALAVEVQAASMEGRLASVNEWRQTFGDVANRAVSQDVFAARSDATNQRVNSIEQRLANYDGRIVGTSAGFATASAIITLVISIVLFGGA